MFVRKVLNEVKNVLAKNGILCDGDLILVKVENELMMFNCSNGDDNYIVRYYSGEEGKEIVSKYLLMEKYGISKCCYIVENNMVVYKDFSDNGNLRVVDEFDLDNERVVEGIALLLKKIHSLRSADCLKYDDYFTKENLEKIMNKFSLCKDEALLYVYNNFDNIRLKFERASKTFILGGFSLERLVFCEDDNSVFVSDYDALKVGLRGEDLISILSLLKEEKRDVFKKAYGSVDEGELLVSYIVKIISNLYLACLEKEFPYWVKESLDCLCSGDFLQKAKLLVEWY